MSTSDTPPRDPADIRDEIDVRAAELLDYNQKVVTILRGQMKDYETLASFYQQQKDRCYKIYSLIGELLMVAAENVGDVLLAEFGNLMGIPADIDEDEDEEEDEDGEE